MTELESFVSTLGINITDIDVDFWSLEILDELSNLATEINEDMLQFLDDEFLGDHD